MSKLLKNFPLLMDEYEFEKNKNINLEKITSGSNKSIWWRCKNHHLWTCSPKERTQKGSPKRCPACRSFAYKRPDLLEEFDTKKMRVLIHFK